MYPHFQASIENWLCPVNTSLPAVSEVEAVAPPTLHMPQLPRARVSLSSPEAIQERAQVILVTLGLRKVVCQGGFPCLGDRVWGNPSMKMDSGVMQTRVLYREVKWSFPSLDDLVRADH